MAIERVMLVTTDATKTPAKLVFNENTLKVFALQDAEKLATK